MELLAFDPLLVPPVLSHGCNTNLSTTKILIFLILFSKNEFVKLSPSWVLFDFNIHVVSEDLAVEIGQRIANTHKKELIVYNSSPFVLISFFYISIKV